MSLSVLSSIFSILYYGAKQVVKIRGATLAPNIYYTLTGLHQALPPRFAADLYNY